MSGGSFNYAYSHVADFARDLRAKLDEHPEYWDDPAVLAKLREIAALAQRAADLMFEAEWLYSGDTGEDTFLARVKKIES